MSINIFYQNVRGLRTKLDELELNLLNMDSDIICLTESWLNDKIYCEEYLNDDYISHRRDRNYATHGSSRGGGSLILTKKTLPCTRLYEFESDINFVEDIWIKINLPNGALYICTVYITSMSDNDHLYKPFVDKALDNLSKISCEDRVFILGDFNIREIEWLRSSDGLLYPTNAITDRALELMSLINFGKFTQSNNVINKDFKILDLAFSSENCGSITIVRSPYEIHHLKYLSHSLLFI